MESEALSEILAIGETADVEFKRCGQQPERGTFESACSFANTFGGSIFLGVEDDGTVSGVKADNLLAIKRNVVNIVNNPKLFDSPVAFKFERIDIEGKVVLRLWVPPSPNMHRFKGDIYERVEDSDVVVRSASRLAEICIRKQGLYTEQRVYKHVALSGRLRNWSTSTGSSPWGTGDRGSTCRHSLVGGHIPAMQIPRRPSIIAAPPFLAPPRADACATETVGLPAVNHLGRSRPQFRIGLTTCLFIVGGLAGNFFSPNAGAPTRGKAPKPLQSNTRKRRAFVRKCEHIDH